MILEVGGFMFMNKIRLLESPNFWSTINKYKVQNCKLNLELDVKLRPTFNLDLKKKCLHLTMELSWVIIMLT